MSDKYKFNLRKDMPRGFKANNNYPELPAILGYLQLYEDRVFATLDLFQDQLGGFLAYLVERKIHEGSDPKLREGLRVEKLPERFKNASNTWDYIVYTPASNGPGRCVFGGLERIT